MDLIGKIPIYFSRSAQGQILVSVTTFLWFWLNWHLAIVISTSKNARQVGRSFWQSAHTRYFSQLNLSSSSVILLQHLQTGQSNQCRQHTVLSIGYCN